ncbi:MAG: GAF domain-containing SpoIIE family protein phosphatase [Nitrospirota bacterium]
MEKKCRVSEEYLRRLKKKVEDLKILTEVSALISSTLDLNELMTLVIDKAKSLMMAEACSILLYNRSSGKLEFEIALCRDHCAPDVLREKISLDIGQGIAGWVAKHRKVLVIKDVRKDKRFYQEADKATGFVTKSLLAAPLVGRRGLIGVAEIINPKRKDYDLDMLDILSKHFAVAIENAIYHRESLERERLKQELEIASTLQKSFLPEKPVMRKGNVIVSAVNFPAKQVGGDLYDFVEPGKEKIGVFIGDISGKGVSAALYMAKIISDFRYISHLVESPEIVMNRLNEILSKAPRGMFLTAQYAIVDVVTGEVRFCDAGHPPFLLIRDGKAECVSPCSGPPLGIISEALPVNTLSLRHGDRLLLLTDGVFEAMNREGKRLGFDNLVKFVRKKKKEEHLIDAITEHVRLFSKGADMADDLTLVEIRFLKM